MMDPKNLLYISWGAGPHIQELKFSILSARHFLTNGDPQLQILIYTDRPDLFVDVPASVHGLSQETLQAWAGPHDYAVRRKICVLQEALERFPAATALIDSDTFFSRSPFRLFSKIAPGRTVMHLKEGYLRDTTTGTGYGELSRFCQDRIVHDLDGKPSSIDPNAAMWNSGVVGIHPDDSYLLKHTISLMDEIYSQLPIRTAEQFAVGQVLEKHTDLQECGEIVFHYWMDHIRLPFREKMDELFAIHPCPFDDGVAARFYHHRPRLPWKRRLRRLVRKTLERCGYRHHEIRFSA